MQNQLNILRYFFFEPILLQSHLSKLDANARRMSFTQMALWLILFVLAFWFLSLNIFIWINPPDFARLQFVDDFVLSWEALPNNYLDKLDFLISQSILEVSSFILSGFIIGISFTSDRNIYRVAATTFVIVLLYYAINQDVWTELDDTARLRSVLLIASGVMLLIYAGGGTNGGLSMMLGGAFIIVLSLGLKNSGYSGFAIGFGTGTALGLSFGLNGNLRSGAITGLFLAFIYGMPGHQAGIVGYFLGYMLGFFRVFLIPIYLLLSARKMTFKNNPYRYDGLIWIPIWKIEEGLLKKTFTLPNEALDFQQFLLKYRPIQKSFALKLVHAQTAGSWRQRISQGLPLPSPNITNEKVEFIPSNQWQTDLKSVNTKLGSFNQMSNISGKIRINEALLDNLETLKTQTYAESSQWNNIYLQAIEEAQAVILEKLNNLKTEAETVSPINLNIYRAGDPLHPDYDKDIFVGREDIRDDLSLRILESRTMPMFLVHGQRRVGKTSLLNFLPEILGPGFTIIQQDLQRVGKIDILTWFKDLKNEIDKRLALATQEEVEWEAKNNWIENWHIFQQYVKSKQDHFNKLILAIDEYEKLHYEAFSEDPEQAKHLLGAMRSFSQHQNKVVFLFIGSQLFSELKNPNWNIYFVQTQIFKVDYLPEDAALKLITQPNEDFSLKYNKNIPHKIYQLTQGHPALVQIICEEIVNIANRNVQAQVGKKELEEALDNRIFRRQNGVIDVFWDDFCREKTYKQVALQIVHGKKTNNKIIVNRMLEHGYVQRDQEQLKMRVPLFHQWLLQFG